LILHNISIIYEDFLEKNIEFMNQEDNFRRFNWT